MIFGELYASKGACTALKEKNGILINRLYRERLLFLGQEVDSEISNQLISLYIFSNKRIIGAKREGMLNVW